MGRLDKISTVEGKKRRKKIIKSSTYELMNPSALSRAKRTSEEGDSGLPSKKRAVSLYDHDSLPMMVEAGKQPRQSKSLETLFGLKFPQSCS